MGRTNRLGQLRSFISIPVHDSFSEDVAILKREASDRGEDFAPFLRRHLRRVARGIASKNAAHKHIRRSQ